MQSIWTRRAANGRERLRVAMRICMGLLLAVIAMHFVSIRAPDAWRGAAR